METSPQTNNGQTYSVNSLNDALAQLQEELLQFKEAVAHIEESRLAAHGAAEAAERVQNAAGHLIAPVKRLVDTMDQVDFPSRLDKLDATVSTIGMGMQNLFARFDAVEKSLKVDLASVQKDVRNSANELARRLSLVAEKNEGVRKVVDQNRILMGVVLVLVVITLVLMIF